MDEARRAALLEDYKDATRERDQLNVYVEALAGRLGIKEFTAASVSAADDSANLTDDVTTLVYEGEFVGMGIPAASEITLRRWSPVPAIRPIKTTGILSALRKGGLDIAEPRIVYRSLYSTPRFKNLKGGFWGLAEWYPTTAPTKVVKVAPQDSHAELTAAGSGEPSAPEFPSLTEEGFGMPKEAAS
jgi:hypothetical protein